MKKFTKAVLREEMKRRKVKVPALSELTDIPKDRIYAWYRDNTNPKKEDQEILEAWLNEVPFKKNEEKTEELPLGNLKVTLEDYVNEIKRQRDYLEKLVVDKSDKIIAILTNSDASGATSFSSQEKEARGRHGVADVPPSDKEEIHFAVKKEKKRDIDPGGRK